MNGCWGQSGPEWASIRIMLLSKKWSSLWEGRMKENVLGVSLTERHRVTLWKVHFEQVSGWVVSPSWRSAWNEDSMIAFNSKSSRSVVGRFRRYSRASSVKVHLHCVPVKPHIFLVPERVCVMRMWWWFVLMYGKCGSRELIIPERYCITEAGWCGGTWRSHKRIGYWVRGPVAGSEV